MAIKVGGKGDVTDSHVLWTSKNSSYVATPVLVNRVLHWIDDKGMYYCANAENGALIRRDRISQIDGNGRPAMLLPRTSGNLVIEPADTLKVVSQNRFESDHSIFNATPAIEAGQLFLRSNEFLYCVGKK